MMNRVCAIVLVLCACPWPLSAQDPGAPSGPADVINRARQQRTQRQQQAALQAGAATGVANPHADPHQTTGAERKPTSEAQANAELPPGTIRVRVFDQDEQPVADQKVRIGIMKSDGKREQLHGETDPEGVYRLDELAVGDQQSYRVNVPYQGARYSSSPFRLPHKAGFDVVIRRTETTRDDSQVFLYVGQLSIELGEERLELVQQAQLANIGSRTYVFPEGGMRVELPEGATAFQAQESMGDQRLERAEEAFVLDGSLPPGLSTVTWAYHVPISGQDMSLRIPVPWKTFSFRVLSDAPEGMALAVEGMPAPRRVEHRGRQIYVTEVRKAPEDEPLRQLSISVRGIPGPGMGRWWAAGLALLTVAIGFIVARRPADAGRSQAEQLAARKRMLLDEARDIEAQREREEIGPEYHKERMDAIATELALVLREQAGSR